MRGRYFLSIMESVVTASTRVTRSLALNEIGETSTIRPEQMGKVSGSPIRPSFAQPQHGPNVTVIPGFIGTSNTPSNGSMLVKIHVPRYCESIINDIHLRQNERRPYDL